MKKTKKYKILNLDPFNFSKEAIEMLKQHFVYIEKILDRKDLLKEIANYEIVILRFAHKIDEEVLLNAKRLKILATNATGTNHIDENVAYKMNIKIISLKNQNSFMKNIHASAEHTWALLLSLTRRIPSAYNSVVKSDLWNRNLFIGNEINGKTIGILGFGRNGFKVAQYAISFNMNVIAYDIKEIKTELNVKFYKNLNSFLKKSEFLCILLPYSDKTYNFVDKKVLEQLPKNSYVINTSRGEIVNDDDLIKYIQNKKIAGYAADVLRNENEKDFLTKSKLALSAKKYNNIILTPHIAGATTESWKKTEIFIAKKIIKVMDKLNDEELPKKK
jgi:D-3-phosphoglycerate dehydrogenase